MAPSRFRVRSAALGTASSPRPSKIVAACRAAPGCQISAPQALGTQQDPADWKYRGEKQRQPQWNRQRTEPGRLPSLALKTQARGHGTNQRILTVGGPSMREECHPLQGPPFVVVQRKELHVPPAESDFEHAALVRKHIPPPGRAHTHGPTGKNCDTTECPDYRKRSRNELESAPTHDAPIISAHANAGQQDGAGRPSVIARPRDPRRLSRAMPAARTVPYTRRIRK